MCHLAINTIVIALSLNSFIFAQNTLSETEKFEQKIFYFVNEERIKNGLEPYSHNDDLQELARNQSKNMAYYHFFSHKDPIGMGAQKRKDTFFPELFGKVGENIAMIKITKWKPDLAKQFMYDWLSSPGHRKNILENKFSYIGIGVVQNGKKYYATQVFGDLLAKMVTELPENLSFKSEKQLKFKYFGKFPKNKIEVRIHFPDINAVFHTKEDSVYFGIGVYQPKWIEDFFIFQPKFKYGKGTYIINILVNRQYYHANLNIRVE